MVRFASLVDEVFVASGNMYFLTVITPLGKKLAGEHLHLFYLAQPALALALRQATYSGGLAVRFDGEGNLLKHTHHWDRTLIAAPAA